MSRCGLVYVNRSNQFERAVRILPNGNLPNYLFDVVRDPSNGLYYAVGEITQNNISQGFVIEFNDVGVVTSARRFPQFSSMR